MKPYEYKGVILLSEDGKDLEIKYQAFIKAEDEFTRALKSMILLGFRA